MNFRFLLPFALFVSAALARAESVPLQILEELNLARTQPGQYAQIVARRMESSRNSKSTRAVTEAIDFLRNAQPLPPLAWSRGISQAALSHTLDVGPRGASGHHGSRGESPWKRMARFGQWEGHAGENIHYGQGNARSIVIALIVDQGVPSRMHRTNIFNRNFRVTGIAVGSHATSGSMCVMNFAGGFTEGGEPRVASRGLPLRSKDHGTSLF